MKVEKISSQRDSGKASWRRRGWWGPKELWRKFICPVLLCSPQLMCNCWLCNWLMGEAPLFMTANHVHLQQTYSQRLAPVAG